MASTQPNTADNSSTPNIPPIPTPPTPLPGIPKADTDTSWGTPAGLHVRPNNDENLIIFRRAVGIENNLIGTPPPPEFPFPDTTTAVMKTLEEGEGNRRVYLRGRPLGGGCRGVPAGKKRAMGMYAAVLRHQRSKRAAHLFVTTLIYASHVLQVVLGASLTALGPTAGSYTTLITLLGAINTVVAGILALIKGQGLAERLRHDQAEFRKLQDWIEQTEALLAVGVIGRNRQEVGLLVQVAFKKYNAAKTSEENNVPENYGRGTGWSTPGMERGGVSEGPHSSLTGGGGIRGTGGVVAGSSSR